MVKMTETLTKVFDIKKINNVSKFLVVIIFSCIISRGTILGYMPMAIALYICVINDKRIRFITFLSIVTGIASTNSLYGIRYIMILIVLSTIIYMFDFFGIDVKNLYIIGTLTTFIMAFALPPFINYNPYGLLGALLESFGVFVLSILFQSSIDHLLYNQNRHYIELTISAALITFALILGLYGILWIEMPVINTLVLSMIIFIGYTFGLEISSVFSVIVSFALYYTYDNYLYFIYFVVVGIAAGIFKRLGKVGCLVGAVGIYILLYSLYDNSDLLMLLKSVVISSGIYMLIPFKVNEKEEDKISIKEKYIIGELDKVAIAYANLSKLFRGTTHKKNQLTKEEIDDLIDEVAMKVCLSCSMCEDCWKKNFYATYKTIYSILEELENKGQVFESDLPKSFYGNCINAEEFVKTVNKVFELYKTNLKWENRLSDSRALFSQQLINVANTIMYLSETVKNVQDKALVLAEETEKEKYKLVKAVAKVSREKGLLSGDNYTFIELNENNELIALSDGMGSGSRAYRDSDLAIEALELLCEGGFDIDIALNTINTLLGVKNNQESFATMDVSVVNKGTLESFFVKNGAVATYIKRGSEVEVITLESLPFGMVKEVEHVAIKKQLEENDLLIMVTDGVVENPDIGLDKEDIIIKYLEETDLLNPKRLADGIIELSSQDYCHDDMMVIVVRIIKKND